MSNDDFKDLKKILADQGPSAQQMANWHRAVSQERSRARWTQLHWPSIAAGLLFGALLGASAAIWHQSQDGEEISRQPATEEIVSVKW